MKNSFNIDKTCTHKQQAKKQISDNRDDQAVIMMLNLKVKEEFIPRLFANSSTFCLLFAVMFLVICIFAGNR
jgi:hypothetical protein